MSVTAFWDITSVVDWPVVCTTVGPAETVAQVPSPFKYLSGSEVVGAGTRPALPATLEVAPVNAEYVVSVAEIVLPEIVILKH